ncbi:hypothetical protein DPEC_G00338320 [Dallia pectoralis]|uniref:Uncharacterized protein n=1 Tax=Dallia pectoralis TaxID=75939 RepID=A0ACC2F4Q0_DALPE|nr:hypothetical protein DPEC_G00338320 [Dallia pectoralis]
MVRGSVQGKTERLERDTGLCLRVFKALNRSAAPAEQTGRKNQAAEAVTILATVSTPVVVDAFGKGVSINKPLATERANAPATPGLVSVCDLQTRPLFVPLLSGGF